MDSPLIPVICDRCRAEGHAGGDRFTEIADLLNFDPVPRRAHVNNWTAEHQRAFIAALAITGSPRMAARALGRHPFGAEQLKGAKGGRGFAGAWDAALELYRERELFRIREQIVALCDQQEERDELAQSHLRALPPPTPSPRTAAGEGWGEGYDDEDSQQSLFEKSELTLQLIGKYAIKLQMERRCRHAGKIAEADFYLRQATWFEVAIDLTTPSLIDELAKVQRGGHDLLEIADTPACRVLDNVRRKYWECAGEPERPPVPVHLLVDHRTHRTEPLPSTGPASRAPPWADAEEWKRMDYNQQDRVFEEQYARDAEAYAGWLAAQHRAYEERQRSDASS